ncbi:MAG: transposase [Gammaproteobacteria bacterium]|nr:transposase [Gammaproteobacteria bacterium]
MARMARVVVPNYPHHVTQRGNRRQKTFFCEDDYRYYIDLISEFSRQSGTEVWAYCLMPNHVHLVMVPGEEDGLRAALGEAHRRYTRHVNIREGWRGHLWQERFHSFTMDEGYLLSTVRYVERNPVVARLCAHPEDWKWSSARAHLKGENDQLVRVKPMLDRIDRWNAYLSDEDQCNDEDLIELHTRTGRPLGCVDFLRKLEVITGEELVPKRPGRKPVIRE